MDTFTTPEPTTPEPVPARDGRDAPSRLRLLATSVAVAGLTATGGLAVILSTAATSGTPAATTTADSGGISAPQVTADPSTTTAPNAIQNGTPTKPQTNGLAPGQFGGQPPQFGQGSGPGHASSGGS